MIGYSNRWAIGLALCSALAACGRSQSSGSSAAGASPGAISNPPAQAGVVAAPTPVQPPAPLSVMPGPPPVAPQAPLPDSGGKLNFEASCALDGTTVKGYIRNKSPESYRVNGMVRFSFPALNVSVGEIRVSAAASIPPNQTTLAASAPVPFVIGKQVACRFDIDDALRLAR